VTARRRSVHFVPGGNERFWAKALAGAADTLIIDLEDSVPAERKPAARAAALEWLADRGPLATTPGREAMVRVNAVATPWGRDDVEAIATAGTDSLMVPKVDGPADLDTVAGWLAGAGGADTVALFPVATETALGALNVHAVAAHPRVDGLCWGAEDLSAEVGATSSRRPDGSLRPLFETVRHLCLLGAAMGFTGKITVHPDQIEVVNEVFTPSAGALERAQALVEAFAVNETAGRSAFLFDGQMVDAPHLARARRLLARMAP